MLKLNGLYPDSENHLVIVYDRTSFWAVLYVTEIVNNPHPQLREECAAQNKCFIYFQKTALHFFCEFKYVGYRFFVFLDTKSFEMCDLSTSVNISKKRL